MSILRAPRPHSNFYILNKSISEDQSLSWAARGLLVYLLGKPDHWRVSTAALIKETERTRLHSGRDAVRALLGELIEAGYITRTSVRDGAGKITGYDYTVSELCASPETGNPSPDKASMVKPGTDHPGPDKPSPADPPLVSIDNKSSIEKEVSIEVATGSSTPDRDANLPDLFHDEKAERKVRQQTEPKKEAETAPIWNAYAAAYEKRYGVPPVRNARVNGQLSQFVKRLGAEEAPQVAAWFVWHNNRYYVQKTHSVNCLLADAENLRTEWATGRRVTATAAQEADRLQETGDMWARIIEKHRSKV
jgi:hypothetical protein